MNIVIFDTETTSLEKPFCYNVGYVIVDTFSQNVILEKEFVCEQVWHNPMLFTTAYYSDKRDFYVNEMRARHIVMNKFGYICQEMIRDFKKFNVEMAFAYNSSFDDKVFSFNCDWFKCNNPFDNVEIKDIRGFAHHFLINNEYIDFCEKNQFFTENHNYSTTAEIVYRFITQNLDFIENHTALDDSKIETKILLACVKNGANINDNYEAKKSIKREVPQSWTIDNGKEKKNFNAYSVTVYKNKRLIKIKESE